MEGCGVSVAGVSVGKMMYPLVSGLAASGVPVMVRCWVLELSCQPCYRWLQGFILAERGGGGVSGERVVGCAP